MRIIGGTLAGRKLTPSLKGWNTRPTSDRVKESLFNILMNRLYFENLKVLDLYAGTGNISFEFLSRGVLSCSAVEKNNRAILYMENTAEEFGVSGRLSLHQMDAVYFIKLTDEKYHFIFADPPYSERNLSDLPNLISEYNLLKNDGLFVLEHDGSCHFDHHPKFIENRSYGTTYLSFFRN